MVKNRNEPKTSDTSLDLSPDYNQQEDQNLLLLPVSVRDKTGFLSLSSLLKGKEEGH